MSIPNESTYVAAGSNNATLVKTGRAFVYGIHVGNASAGIRYLKLYDRAALPTMGTTLPIVNIMIPAGASLHVPFPEPITFALGLSFAMTTGQALLDNTAVTAGDLALNLFWR